MTDELKTYPEWAAVGRNVRRGQSADFYRISDDGLKGAAVFSIDQTDDLDNGDIASWTTVVSAADWKNRTSSQKKYPTIRVRPWGDDGVAVWCGNDEYAIKALQHAGYQFDMRERRWRSEGRTVEHVAKGFEGTGRFTVVVEAPLEQVSI